jgi:hypothetical protein
MKGPRLELPTDGDFHCIRYFTFNEIKGTLNCFNGLMNLMLTLLRLVPIAAQHAVIRTRKRPHSRDENEDASTSAVRASRVEDF